MLLIFSGVLIFGCSKEEAAAQLSAELTSDTISADITSGFLKIQSNSDWEIIVSYISGEQGWCTPNLNSGKGNANAILVFTKNTSSENRKAEIKIKSGKIVVSLTITQLAFSGNSGGDGGGTGNLKWLEIPSKGTNPDCELITHSITLSGKQVRSYTLLYDKKEKIAYWVAYPHNPVYIGSSGRTDNWQYDPSTSSTNQPSLFTGISGYDRGHQIPSADRTCSDEANSQTFYFTNMTPQLGTLNQNLWANLEGQVRSWMEGCDTLYVVTGAVLKTVGNNETVKYAYDRNGVQIAVPNYYYKVLLRLKNSKYDAIGFWFEHRSYGNGQATASETKSVDQIETLTGFDFFSNLPDNIENTVESAWSPSSWNLL